MKRVMRFQFDTFSNDSGGNALFKALGHPLVSEKAAALISSMAGKRVGVFDPVGQLACFQALYDMGDTAIEARFVQRVVDLSGGARPITDLPEVAIEVLFIAAFDAEYHLRSVLPMLPSGVTVVSFDVLRLPDEMLSDRRSYVSPMNFATNFCLFRADGERCSVMRTVEYWTRYGAKNPALWLMLFDADGKVLAQWTESLVANQSIKLHAGEIRARFGLPAFAGSLFVHAIGIAGHDIMKYVLDDEDADGISPAVTHDSNSWPADYYAGVPAAEPGETVLLWVQNSHPIAIPAGTLSFNRMGRTETAAYQQEIPAFGTHAIDMAQVLPDLSWPDQIEFTAGRHCGRPRYELRRPDGTVTLAHANVERTDLKLDPGIAGLGEAMGKGYLLPAPVLPRDRFQTELLPTPMTTAQRSLPLAVHLYDPDGALIVRESLGDLPRDHRRLVQVEEMLKHSGATMERGHLELVYDFSGGGQADGWLHALFRYRHVGGQVADSSFGAHIFNTAMVYKGEPQSYHGKPPGLTTRLLLRLAPKPAETLCCLIYPASTPWWPKSTTVMTLANGAGEPVAEATLNIPCSGSRLWSARDIFSGPELRDAGPEGTIAIVDRTCRLFGYHAALSEAGGFALDHMFGF